MKHDELRIATPKWPVWFWIFYVFSAVFLTASSIVFLLGVLYSFGLIVYRYLMQEISLTRTVLTLLLVFSTVGVGMGWMSATLHTALVSMRFSYLISEEGITVIPPALSILIHKFTISWSEIQEVALAYMPEDDSKPDAFILVKRGTKKNIYGKIPVTNPLYYRQIVRLPYSVELDEFLKRNYTRTISKHYGGYDKLYQA